MGDDPLSRADPLIGKVNDVASMPTVLDALGFRGPAAVLVLVGGAATLQNPTLDAVHGVFRNVVVPVCEELGVVVVDGGTDSGVMMLIGRAREAANATFSLLGVAAAGTVSEPGTAESPTQAPLEPHHSHILLVPGDEWGDESPWIAEVASRLAGTEPIVGLVVGGGTTTISDMQQLLMRGIRLVALAGTGGVVDELAEIEDAAVVADLEAPELLELLLRSALTSGWNG